MGPCGKYPRAQVLCMSHHFIDTFALATFSRLFLHLLQLDKLQCTDGPFSQALAAMHLAVAARHASLACMPGDALWAVAGVIDLAGRRQGVPWPTGKEAGYAPLVKRVLTENFGLQFRARPAWRALPSFTAALEAAGGGECWLRSAQVLKW